MVALSRTRDLLERVIVGEEMTDPRVADLVPTVRALASVDIGCHPDPAFVAALGARLLAEARSLPVRAVDPAPTRPSRSTTGGGTARGSQPPQGPHPVIIFVGHGWPRLLAGVAASLIAVASIVGVVSRSALPGQALYPVKQVLDTAAVDLSGSDFDKGQTLLGQAEGHVADAAQLVTGPSPTADDVNTALAAAIDTTTRGQVLLDQAYVNDRQDRALTVLRDFSARLIPRVDALTDRVPPGSVASLQRLRALLGRVQASATSALAGCQTCGDAGVTARAGLPGAAPGVQGAGSSPSVSQGISAGADPGGAAATTATTATTAPPAATITAGAPGAPAIPGVGSVAGVPGSSGARGPGGSAGVGGSNGGSNGGVGVGVGVGVGGVSVGVRSGGVGVGPTGGGGVGVHLPGATATVGVPSVTAGGGGIGVGGGGVGVGLPSGTVTLPLPGLTLGGGGIGAGGGGVGVGLPSGTISVPLPGLTLGGGGLGVGGLGVGGNGAGKATNGTGGIPVISTTCVLILCLP